MPAVKHLLQIFEKEGLEVIDVFEADKNLYCYIKGECLRGATAIVRANENVCNIGIMLGLFDVVEQGKRYILLQDLLEANFKHPLARVSMFKTVPEDENKQGSRILVAESSFYWDTEHENWFDGRMKALSALAWNVSNLLAGYDSITSMNPYFSQLKGPRSPVVRDGDGLAESIEE